MAITYPLDLLDALPGWSTDFNLLYRQEQSRHASGRTRVKDYGTPIWQATYTTKNLSPNTLDFWRARLNSLENGLQTFRAYPKSRCWPIAHPNGEIIVDESGWVLESDFWNDNGQWLTGIPWSGDVLTSGLINTKNVNNKALSLKEMPFLTLSVGDYLSIDGKLHQLVEGASSLSSGVTGEFEVRPHLDVSIGVNDTVLINKPYCLMTLVPGSVSASSGLNGRGSISFQAIEARG